MNEINGLGTPNVQNRKTQSRKDLNIISSNFVNMGLIENKVKELKKSEYTYKEILLILYQETGKFYSLETIKKYSKSRMDINKDNTMMAKWRREYEVKQDSPCSLDILYNQFKSKGMTN